MLYEVITIELSSYTEEEKVGIARDHLIPKQRAAHGLEPQEAVLQDSALLEIIIV